MLATTFPSRVTIEKNTERLKRSAKAVLRLSELRQRRQMAKNIQCNPELHNIVDDNLGYVPLPFGKVKEVGKAIDFSHKILDQQRDMEWPDNKRYLTVLSNPNRYEEAPPLFDLALSDDLLQIATEYLGEVPRLVHILLWWTPVNATKHGSQLYHRDGMCWLRRQAKFLFVMNDVDENCGPFTFLPADLSMRIATSLGSILGQRRVNDEDVYRFAKPSDAISLTGPAGTGAMVDSSSCFHYGARSRGGERLMLVINFQGSLDAAAGIKVRQTDAFKDKFGDDPVRNFVVPRQE
jgi:hypothetical protein